MFKAFLPRTDLAMESYDPSDQSLPRGVFAEQQTVDGVIKTTVLIETDEAAKRLGRPCGEYITLEGDNSICGDTLCDLLTDGLEKLLPEGETLVVGLGNRDITPDIIGPAAASQIMATRHLFSEQLERMGFEELRSVCVIAPGVMGQTGIEVFDIVKSLTEKYKFTSVIAIDALAARSSERLGKTIQLSNSGISPGSGVLNRRAELSEKTLGIPVIAIGVPTVVDAATLIYDLCPNCDIADSKLTMMVTPRDIDAVSERGAKIIARAVNRALQPQLTDDEIALLTS